MEAFPHSIVRYIHFLQVSKFRKRSSWDDAKLGEDKPPEKRVGVEHHSLSIHWPAVECLMYYISQQSALTKGLPFSVGWHCCYPHFAKEETEG